MARSLSLSLIPVLLVLGACGDPSTSGTTDPTGTVSDELAKVPYIIGFRDEAAGRAALASNGASVTKELRSIGAVVVTLPLRAIDALSTNAAIEYVEEDSPRYPLAQSTPYGIGMVQADLVWPTTRGGKKVCVIDSGVNVNHEDLVGNRFAGYAAGTGNWYEDGCGHGTHVTGTIAAQNNSTGVVGVNTAGIDVYMVKVFGNDCTWTYSSTLVDAAERCAAAGASVISMSLGGGARSHAEDKEFTKLWNQGIISVAAAGNDGTTRLSFPASYSNVISVAAVDNTMTVATFSQQNREVDIAAPGVGVLSTVPFLGHDTASVNGATYSGGAIDGAASSQSGVSGALVDGGLCDVVGSWSGKVVLCQRGTITFAQKVTNVVSGGGVAAILYNNVSGGFAGTLNGTANIPAISLSLEDGQAIIAGGGVGKSATVVSYVEKPASGYEAWDGTSMATPHVSGVAALIWSAYPTKTATQVRAALQNTARDLGAAGRDNAYGYGLVQAKAALDYLGSH
jgi:subtilisin family serine protease